MAQQTIPQTKEARETTSIRVYAEAPLRVVALQGLLAQRGERATQADVVEAALDAYKKQLESEEEDHPNA